MAETNTRVELFEGMVRTGFEPLRMFVEHKRMEEDLSDEDIEKVMEVIGANLSNWVAWMRHQKSHSYPGDRR